MNKTEFKEFDHWWVSVAQPRVNHFIDGYLDEFPDYTEEDMEDYTDSGCVHRLVHEGETENTVWEICQEVFEKGYDGVDWSMSMSDSLFCELDNVIELAFEAGQRAGA